MKMKHTNLWYKTKPVIRGKFRADKSKHQEKKNLE